MGGSIFKRKTSLRIEVVPEFASFTGTFTDQGVDTDGDTRFDLIRIDTELDVKVPGEYQLIIELEASNGEVIASSASADLLAGTQPFSVDFSIAALQRLAVNGPYTGKMAILFTLSTDGNREIIADQVTNAFTTQPYNLSDEFDRRSILLTGNTNDFGVDNFGSGKFDELVVEIEVDVLTAGSYTYQGNLVDQSGVKIGFAKGTVSLPAGKSFVSLTYNGAAIQARGIDGPYTVTSFIIFGNIKSFTGNDVATTQAYRANEFVGVISVTGTSNDFGRDTLGSGVFDQLVVEIEVDTLGPGFYEWVGTLVDSMGKEIDIVSSSGQVAEGISLLDLKFDGLRVFINGVNGPYFVKIFFILGEGLRINIEQVAVTQAYSFDQFIAGPILEGLYPAVAECGGLVTIEGRGFAEVDTSNIVNMGGFDILAEPISDRLGFPSPSSEFIVFRVPLNFAPGQTTLTVTRDGNVSNALGLEILEGNCDATAPGAAINLAATLNGNQVELTWTAPVDADIFRFIVLRGDSSSGPFSSVGSVFENRFVDILPAKQGHFYRVRVVDTAGNESVDSASISIEPNENLFISFAGATEFDRIVQNDTLRYAIAVNAPQDAEIALEAFFPDTSTAVNLTAINESTFSFDSGILTTLGLQVLSVNVDSTTGSTHPAVPRLLRIVKKLETKVVFLEGLIVRIKNSHLRRHVKNRIIRHLKRRIRKLNFLTALLKHIVQHLGGSVETTRVQAAMQVVVNEPGAIAEIVVEESDTGFSSGAIALTATVTDFSGRGVAGLLNPPGQLTVTATNGNVSSVTDSGNGHYTISAVVSYPATHALITVESNGILFRTIVFSEQP